MKNGWQTKKLGDLCEIELGKTPARANIAFWDEERKTNNVWLSIADLLKVEDNVVVDSKEYLSDKGAAISKTVRKGTLLVSFKLTLGRLAFAGRDLFTNEAIAALTIFNERELSKEFLFYFLHFFDWRKAAENDVKLKGMTLNKAKLKEMPVLFPSPTEQQRIVGILDEAFDGIATAKANAEKNLQNARALFESHLNSVFTQRGPGWVEKRLGDIAKMQYGLSEPMNEDGQGFKIFRMGEVQDGRLIDTGRMKFANISRTEFAKYKLRPGDVLFNRTNSFELVGKTGIFSLSGDYCFASYLVRVLLNPKIMVSEFLNYLMNSQKFQTTIKKKASKSINQANINATILSNEIVRFPELIKTQNSIVSVLDALREETQRLESIYQQKLAALEELKKSLLDQAFSGAL
jgi:type I restriction enzyme S subunit